MHVKARPPRVPPKNVFCKGDIRFLNGQPFQGNTQDTDYDWVEPAILGAKAGNPFIKEVLLSSIPYIGRDVGVLRKIVS